MPKEGTKSKSSLYKSNSKNLAFLISICPLSQIFQPWKTSQQNWDRKDILDNASYVISNSGQIKHILTICCRKERFVGTPCFISKIFCYIHMPMNFFTHFFQSSADISFPVIFIKAFNYFCQLDFCAIVPDFLIFLTLWIFFSVRVLK